MDWLTHLLGSHSVAGDLLVLLIVAAAGLALGQLQFRGVGLGVGGVLFAGLAFGHFGLTAAPEVLEFVQEFGLILFVFSIGLQVGPGFVDSLRRHGLILNTMAASVVGLGVALTVAVHFFAGVETPAAVGLFSGATTNTPSLAAAVQALKERDADRISRLPASAVPAAKAAAIEATKLPGLGYAVAYPFGIVGIIAAMLLLQALFRIDPRKELAELAASEASSRPKLARRTLEITNPNLPGLTVAQIPGFADLDA
ncbi:MAG: permease, partial [Candidatus Riflebacteria bacterium]|nr:permease [Candidatus Riflebacteria bacterium]